MPWYAPEQFGKFNRFFKYEVFGEADMFTVWRISAPPMTLFRGHFATIFPATMRDSGKEALGPAGVYANELTA
jgi:hypothetical protein